MNLDLHTIKTIYYKCYENSLLGKIDECSIFYNLLKRKFEEKENKDLFKEFLDENKINELKIIKRQIETGKIIEEFDNIEPIEHDIKMSTSEIEEEKILSRHIFKNPKLINSFLNENLISKDLEHPCGPKEEDRCDILMADNNRTIYPIEVKLGKATHAVVGQIEKYCLHFKLKLSYGLYDNVQGVVIANSYSQYAINELRKRRHICLLHSGNIDNIRFSKI